MIKITSADEEKIYQILKSKGGQSEWFDFVSDCEKKGVKAHFSDVLSAVRQGKLSITIVSDNGGTILKLW